MPARLDYFDGFVSDWAGKSVIDVGCGGGFMSEALARRSADVVGLDQSEGAIDAARRHALTTGLSINYRVVVAKRLGFEDESFDTVVCVDVLKHFVDLDCAISEVARKLRSGGLFLFDTINRNRVAKFIVITAAERIVELLPLGAHDPDPFIRPGELRAKLNSFDFKVLDLAGLGPRGLSGQLDIKFGKVPSNLIQYMGVAQKLSGGLLQ